MQFRSLNELRELFIRFFESKDHKRLNSFSLIPKGDKSLLLINSGMAPMKKYFTGESVPPGKRVVTCQKCIRTPDIERVGITARHGTFFEMLGNFSFGDYFKLEACIWAWEFCTEVLKLPKDRLWVSIYEEDDETFDIWTKNVGINSSKVVRLGKADNFWEHGAGPCGPCSELYFDRGEEYGCGSDNCSVGCECDRYVEFWNLVFTQFNNDGKGNYTPLKKTNIDTGMGLERLACIVQGVDNLFLVDTVKNILGCVSELSGVKYGENQKLDISLRVITDHIRSIVFMIGDGVLPSNEGRGYVLRRLLRRALRHGRILGFKDPFLYKVCKVVIEENKSAYPELLEKADFIEKIIRVEEDSFEKTIDQGMNMLSALIEKLETNDVLSGEEAFKLNDTYGFPVDLTKEILSEKGMSLDEEEFVRLMQEQKQKARNARKNVGADAWLDKSIDTKDIPATKFLGYDALSSKGKILAIIKDGKRVDSVFKGDEADVILDKTPMYPESGGQIYDTGNITSDASSMRVINTKKGSGNIIVHYAVVDSDIFSVGNDVCVNVDKERRARIMKNHTGAHLLQAALKKVLGNHVEQAGQLVNEDHIRFDFTHFSALTEEEMKKVEDIINDEIFEGVNIEIKSMPIESAKKIGAIALFGEKYSDIVRVVRLEDGFSIELCGGTHMDNTAKLGLFKIVSENSVASGVRRIQAITGIGVLNLVNQGIDTINKCSKILKLNDPKNLTSHCEQIVLDLKSKDRKIESLSERMAKIKTEQLISNFKTVKGVKLVVSRFDSTNTNELRTMGDKIKADFPDSVAVLVGIDKDKATLLCSVGREALGSGIHAGKLVQKIAKLAGGNGGGRQDFAMAGVKDINKVDEALKSVKSVVEEMI